MQAYPTREELSSAAVAYADAGFRVFPLFPISANNNCTCRNPNCQDAGKHPAVRDWPNAATNDLAIVRKWWATRPCGIGLATGPYTVIDFDLYKNPDAIRELNLPPTRVCITGGGGEHWYYKTPPNTEITNSADKLLHGVDVRGSGGYVVLPPSPHVSGALYEWEDPFVPFTELPQILVEKLRAPERPKRDVLPSRLDSYRDPTMASIAGAMHRVGIAPGDIEYFLLYWNRQHCVPPKPERVVSKIVKSITNKYMTLSEKQQLAQQEANNNDQRILARKLEKSHPEKQ